MKLSKKWGLVCSYTVGIFIISPYLPQLIRAATSRWSSSRVSRLVLGLEIAIALAVLSLAVGFLIRRRKKSTIFLISVGCILLLSLVIYQFIPNPYEFTHLPEYAILSILILRAKDSGKDKYPGTKQEKKLHHGIFKNPYLLSGLITGVVGTGDEVYQHFLPGRFYDWHDVFLNILGGILGLLIFWGTIR